jgi:acyl-coenzyme A synthetase/AMP-(fatty) acid ligase
MTVTAAIRHFGRARPEAPALAEPGRVIVWRELSDLVQRTAGHLAARGRRPGDRVGLCLDDNADHLVTLLALAHIGAVAVPLDWRAPPAETSRLIAGLGLTQILIEAHGRDIDGCPTIRLDDAWRGSVARAGAISAPIGDWGAPFAISATSGSTGRPKFTAMTHAQYYFSVVAMWELIGLVGRHRFLSTMPLYFSSGRNSCLAHLLRGDCLVFHPNLFTPAEYVEVVEREKITTTAIVPSTARLLMAAAGETPLLPGLTAMFCSGAPLHAEEKRQALRRLTPNFHERYGTAETLAISVLRPADFAERPDSVGLPHSLAEIEIVDEADTPLPAGAAGQLRFRAPGMGAPLQDSAAEANYRGGWFYPGEIARLDAAGYIFLEGRTSDVIMRSGAKIHPAEVEAVLAEHAGVLDAAVVGHRGADNEEDVIAFVVPRGEVHAGELLGHCRARLAPHKIPRQFHIVEALPRNTAGKVDRSALAERLTRASDP